MPALIDIVFHPAVIFAALLAILIGAASLIWRDSTKVDDEDDDQWEIW